MNPHSPNLPHLPPLAGGIAALLFGAAVLAFFPYASWFDAVPVRGAAAGAADQAQSDEGNAAAQAVVVPAALPDRARPRCPGCGVVDSVRDVTSEGDAQQRFEITVRLRDGSTRVTHVSDPGQWRAGERTIYID